MRVCVLVGCSVGCVESSVGMGVGGFARRW